MIHGSRCLIFSLFSKRRHPLVIIWLDTWLKPPSSAAPLPRMRRSPPRRPDRFSFGVAGASADPRLSRRVTRLIRVRGPERRADIRPGVSARAPPSTCVSTPASPPRTAPPAPLSAAACPPVLPTRPRPVRPSARPAPFPDAALAPPTPPHLPTTRPRVAAGPSRLPRADNGRPARAGGARMPTRISARTRISALGTRLSSRNRPRPPPRPSHVGCRCGPGAGRAQGGVCGWGGGGVLRRRWSRGRRPTSLATRSG